MVYRASWKTGSDFFSLSCLDTNYDDDARATPAVPDGLLIGASWMASSARSLVPRQAETLGSTKALGKIHRRVRVLHG